MNYKITLLFFKSKAAPELLTFSNASHIRFDCWYSHLCFFFANFRFYVGECRKNHAHVDWTSNSVTKIFITLHETSGLVESYEYSTWSNIQNSSLAIPLNFVFMGDLLIMKIILLFARGKSFELSSDPNWFRIQF